MNYVQPIVKEDENVVNLIKNPEMPMKCKLTSISKNLMNNY